MNAWQISLTVILTLIAAIIAIFGICYYIIIPRVLVKLIRGGKENLKFSDNFEKSLSLIDIERNLVYNSKYSNNTYDLYRPKDGKSKGLIIWMHGGFFIAGDKAGVENVCTDIAANGFSVAAINYATAPENKYPIAVKQLDEFINYIQINFPTLCEKGIIIAGDSAGGQITAQYSMVTCSERLKKDMNFSPCLPQHTLKGVILVCAPIDIAQLRGMHKKLNFLLPIFGRAYFGNGHWYKSQKYKDTHLFDYVDGNFPPCFITDGNRISFEQQNKNLAAKMRENGVDVEELFFESEKYGDVNHEYIFDMSLDTSKIAINKLLEFINTVI